MKVPDPVRERAEEIAEQRDMSMKEAVRLMCREGGYDV
jgi:antitoxin component of RelBE/YafQ-DinJ toxin-antitoxin module